MKLLHHYTKESCSCSGFVAEFCPIERKITRQEIRAIRATPYLTFIRIGDGDFIRNDRACLSCGIVIPNDSSEYQALAPESTATIEELEEVTNPGVSARFHDLVSLGEQIASGMNPDPALRRNLLVEQFTWLEGISKSIWTQETKLDRFSLLTALFSLAAWFLALYAITSFVPEASRLDAVGIVFCAGLVLLIANAFVFFMAPRRAIARKVVPLIAAAIRPLHPSPAEIRAILDAMKTSGFRYSTRVGVRNILRALERTQ